MQFFIKKMVKKSDENHKRVKKCIFLIVPNFGRIENDFGEMWEDFSHNDFDHRYADLDRLMATACRGE